MTGKNINYKKTHTKYIINRKITTFITNTYSV